MSAVCHAGHVHSPQIHTLVQRPLVQIVQAAGWTHVVMLKGHILSFPGWVQTGLSIWNWHLKNSQISRFADLIFPSVTKQDPSQNFYSYNLASPILETVMWGFCILLCCARVGAMSGSTQPGTSLFRRGRWVEWMQWRSKSGYNRDTDERRGGCKGGRRAAEVIGRRKKEGAAVEGREGWAK